jgi:nitrite reductase/ring-hydroxylating ferredoxin subunit
MKRQDDLHEEASTNGALETGAGTKVGTVAELAGEERLHAVVEGVELVVFRLGDEYVAYENWCPHQGGPVCQGRLFKRVRAELAANDEIVERFSDDEIVLNCPWHGYEFDIRTGVCNVDARYRLRPFQVTHDGTDIYVHR